MRAFYQDLIRGETIRAMSYRAMSEGLRPTRSAEDRSQRCWVHKTANVLNKLPKSQQSKVKRALQEIWMAETKNEQSWVQGFEDGVRSLPSKRRIRRMAFKHSTRAYE